MELKPLTAAWADYAAAFHGPFMPRVCLVAPRGSGKTASVRALAAKLGYPLHTLLLGTMAEEDILGLPSVQDGRTVHTLPEWACTDAPCVLFLDELDKASPERQAAILTLLAEGRIHGYQLHPDTLIVCAMQPLNSAADWLSNPTGEALADRLAFVPFEADYRDRLLAQYFGAPGQTAAFKKLSELPRASLNPATLPLAETVSVRNLDACIKAATRGFDLLTALFVPAVAAQFLEGLAAAGDAPDYLAEVLLTADAEVVDTPMFAAITPSMAIHLLRDVAHACVPEVFGALIERGLDAETAAAIPKITAAVFHAQSEHDGTLCGDATYEAVAREYARALQNWERKMLASQKKEKGAK